MAFFRFNRDKRGYEHFYLVEPVTNRRGKSRPRVLYWYRSPPNIKVGRVPFDDDVRRALEAQNPTVTFDWRTIIDAPIPSADAEKWRERRRAERAEKAARQMTPVAEEPTEGESTETASPATATPSAGADAEAIRKRRRPRRGRGPRVEAAAVAPANATSDNDAVAPASVEPAAPTEHTGPSNPAETPGD